MAELKQELADQGKTIAIMKGYVNTDPKYFRQYDQKQSSNGKYDNSYTPVCGLETNVLWNT